MRRMTFALVAALVASVMVAAPVGAADGDELPPPPVRWESCFAQVGPTFECATVRVPLDYDAPRGRQIALRMVRLPASGPGGAQGSLFLNPGGPGGSGIDFVLGAGPALYTDEVRASFDLVGFDPRGIGRSNPLRCFPRIDDAVSVFYPTPFPLDELEAALFAALDTALDAACNANARDIRDHMSTANVARDLDLLRRAVGDEGLTYAGYSYGSFLGAVYANLFPDNVRAVVVDGVLDPIAWTTGVGDEAATLPFSTRLRSDAGAQATLDEFFRLCDEAGPAGCALAPDAADRYAALAERLLDEPLAIVDPGSGEVFYVTYPILIGESLGPLYNSFSWPDFAFFLAQIEALASAEALGEALAAVYDAAGVGVFREPSNYPNFVEGFVGVACSDSVNPDGHSFWLDAGVAAEDEYGYFGRLWTWASGPCAVWSGADDDRYLGPFTNDTANPVLVVGTRYDPATRYEGAEILDGLLPNSALLTVEGWGHTSLFLSACADAAVSEYLLEGTPPPAGTVCSQDIGPFDSAPTLTAAADAAASRAADRAGIRTKVISEVALIPRR